MSKLIELLKSLIPADDPDEAYLAGSADIYELERRVEELERRRGGPAQPATWR
ncbi:MAG: DUF3563 family protein [Burkholderiales bacterium]|nr:DUF3563 family protein [Burkholderiales bacterium]MDE1928472.1 DUF3563 family protein [Burkholderiales bacterium]MDE2161064.1 DUF3563 family protein [Burkholderiales bacterium]MDE2502597.1 DUF3563 family protein [Burkholderiales bacterium]